MYRPFRVAWALLAIGAATAVGVATRDPGFTVITFIGTLALRRVLGFGGRPGWHGGGRSHGCGGYRGERHREDAGTGAVSTGSATV